MTIACQICFRGTVLDIEQTPNAFDHIEPNVRDFFALQPLPKDAALKRGIESLQILHA